MPVELPIVDLTQWPIIGTVCIVRPRVILHTAVSVDGRTDWAGFDVALFYELVGRWSEGATLVGADTLLAAALTEEIPAETEVERAPEPAPGDNRPLLVVVDSKGRIRAWHHWTRVGIWRKGISLCSASTPAEHLAYLSERGVEAFVAGSDLVDLDSALTWLAGEHGVRTVRVDSGGRLNGALLRAGLVDEVSVLIHPSLVGGSSPRSLFRAPDLESSDEVIDLSLEAVERLRGDVVWLRYAVQP